MLIDSHCHLEYKGLVEDQAGVLDRARAAGVGGFLSISTRQREWAQVIGTAERHDAIWASVGIHPHEADQHADLGEAALLAATDHEKVIAIGETGLDYYYDKSDRETQQALFRRHIAVARQTGLPLIVHTRDADDDTMDLLEAEMARGPFTGVIHCYSSSRRLAERAAAIGLYLGIGGILTFKKSDALRATVRDMPLDRLLLETDAPYLAPVPMRGRTNEPAFTASYIDGGDAKLTMNVVVGKPTNQTAFFYRDAQQVDYNPYWGVPQSIIVNEMLPEANRPDVKEN